jgi:hypothetical protein
MSHGSDLNNHVHVLWVGRPALSLSKFISLCDKFDSTYKCKGSRDFFLVVDNDNVISFILRQLGVSNTVYYPPGEGIEDEDAALQDCEAIIAFSGVCLIYTHCILFCSKTSLTGTCVGL